MGSSPDNKTNILILYYSYSSQTKNLLQALSEGMKKYPVHVLLQRIETVAPQHFPIGTVPGTIWKMILTFFRQRIPVQPLPDDCFADFDLVLLAGPTWSYNPSGPVLAVFDRDGRRLFQNKKVIPLISCRGYWRMHWWGLRSLLRKSGAAVPNVIVFTHPSREPWRTLGVFLKLAGKVPERMAWLRNHYPKYGHTKGQLNEAERFGRLIARALTGDGKLADLDFKTRRALYKGR